MIVLHAGFQQGRLLLWGEAPAQPKAPRRRGRSHPPSLPYDAGAERLSAALTQAGVGLAMGKKHIEHVIAWLPTVGDQPLASSPLIAQSPKSRAKPRLAS